MREESKNHHSTPFGRILIPAYPASHTKVPIPHGRMYERRGEYMVPYRTTRVQQTGASTLEIRHPMPPFCQGEADLCLLLRHVGWHPLHHVPICIVRDGISPAIA